MGSAAATDEGAARHRWFISSQSRRALADLAPAVLGFALARSAFLAASYGSYRGTDAGLFTALPTLVAALVALVPFVWFGNVDHRLGKRTVYRLSNAGAAGLVAVLLLHTLALSSPNASAALLFVLSTVSNLCYMATSFFWLRRARGAHSDVVALLVFGTLAVSSLLNYGLAWLPASVASPLMAVLACLQFCCMAAARKRPLPVHVTVHNRLDGYFASPTQAAIGSKRFLAVTALGIVILAMADGLLRGFPFGNSIAFGPLTRTGYSLLVVAVSFGLLYGSVRGSAKTMTLNAWLLMQVLGTAALVLYTVAPQNLAIGAMAANTLNDVLVCYKWYVTIAFMAYGPHDPYYYCIGGWIATLVPRAFARVGAIAFLGAPTSIPPLTAIVGALLLLSAQAVFVQLYNQTGEKTAHANDLPQGLDRLLGLQGIHTFADASQALARDEVARIKERFGLSRREAEVLGFYVLGHTQARIAEELSITPDTVHAHIKRIYAKCDLHSRQDFLDYMTAAHGDVRPAGRDDGEH